MIHEKISRLPTGSMNMGAADDLYLDKILDITSFLESESSNQTRSRLKSLKIEYCFRSVNPPKQLLHGLAILKCVYPAVITEGNQASGGTLEGCLDNMVNNEWSMKILSLRHRPNFITLQADDDEQMYYYINTTYKPSKGALKLGEGAVAAEELEQEGTMKLYLIGFTFKGEEDSTSTTTTAGGVYTIRWSDSNRSQLNTKI